MTDKPKYDLVQAVAEKARASGAKPMRIEPVIPKSGYLILHSADPGDGSFTEKNQAHIHEVQASLGLPAHFIGMDLAKPGSDTTTILRLSRDLQRFRIETIEPRNFYYFMGGTPPRARPLKLRKSQRSTERRLRFERNKAKRLRDARWRREDRAWRLVIHKGRRAGLTTLEMLRQEYLKKSRAQSSRYWDELLWDLLTGKSESKP